MSNRILLAPLSVALAVLSSMCTVAEAQQRAAARAVLVQRLPIEGDTLLLEPMNASVFIDTSALVVLQPRVGQLLRFSRDGTLLRAWGRRGPGPGEFQAPGEMGTLGQRFWVGDAALARFTLYDAAGTLLGTVRFPAPGRGFLLADSSIVLLPRQRFSPVSVSDERVAVRRFRPGRPVPDTVLVLEGIPRVLQFVRGGAMAVGRQPFDDAPLLAVAGDGSRLAVVDRRVASTDGSDRFRVRRFNARGVLEVDRTVVYTPRRLAARLRDSVIAEIAREGSPGERSGAAGRIRAALFAPPFLAPVSGLFVSADGDIWLRREDQGTPTVDWLILRSKDDSGTLVPFPANFAPLAGSRAMLCGREEDAERGVSTLACYRIEPVARAR